MEKGSSGVAPARAVWLSAVDTDDLRILAVAPGSPGPAEAYGREMGCRVPVATLEVRQNEFCTVRLREVSMSSGGRLRPRLFTAWTEGCSVTGRAGGR